MKCDELKLVQKGAWLSMKPEMIGNNDGVTEDGRRIMRVSKSMQLDLPEKRFADICPKMRVNG